VSLVWPRHIWMTNSSVLWHCWLGHQTCKTSSLKWPELCVKWDARPGSAHPVIIHFKLAFHFADSLVQTWFQFHCLEYHVRIPVTYRHCLSVCPSTDSTVLCVAGSRSETLCRRPVARCCVAWCVSEHLLKVFYFTTTSTSISSSCAQRNQPGHCWTLWPTSSLNSSRLIAFFHHSL